MKPMLRTAYLGVRHTKQSDGYMKFTKAEEKQIYRELNMLCQIVDIWGACTILQIDANSSKSSVSAFINENMFHQSIVSLKKAKEYFLAIETDCKGNSSKDLNAQIEYTKEKLNAKYKFC